MKDYLMMAFPSNKKTIQIICMLFIFLPCIVSASTIVWDGGGEDDNWDNALNWSSGIVPGSGDTVIFDSTSTKNCIININISIVGITIASGYTGTITQGAGKTITIGSGSWVQNDGVFIGGDSAITINSIFDLNAGSFTSTSGLLTNNTTFSGNVFDIATTSTFNHNNGSVKFTGGNHYTIDTHNASLFNVEINKCGSCTSSGRVDVDGDLILTSSGWSSMDITLAGNLSGAAVMSHSGANGKITFDGASDQISTFTGRLPNVIVNKANGTLTFSNDFAISNKFTYVTGNVVFTGTTVSFTQSDHWSIDSGAVEFNNVVVNKCPTCDMTVIGTMKVGGDFILTQNNAFNTGTIEIKGNLISTDTLSSGSATIVLTGSNDQLITVGSNDLPNGLFTINKPSGKVTLGADLVLNGSSQDLMLTSGTLDLAGFNVTIPDVITITDKLKLKGNETITSATFSLNTSSSTVEYYDSDVTADLSKLPPSTFNHFILGAGKTHLFEVGLGNQITINGNFSSQGNISSKSTLRSLNAGSQWYIKVNGSESIHDNVDVQDSNASNGIAIDGNYSDDSGNNTNWLFSAPYITNVTSTNNDGSYNQGNSILVKITFNDAVTVVGNPTLALETGATDRLATYTSGSSTNELIFTYVVQIGDSSSDLDYLSSSALSLNGGSIKKGSYTNANLSLPTPGSAGSLAANKNLVIYTFSATAQSVSLNEDIITNITLSSNYAGTNTLTYSIVTPPAHGNLVFSSGATYTYTPASNYNGSDSFTFNAVEGSQNSTTATVNLTITGVDDAPVAVTDTYSAVANVPVNYDVLSNDYDPEGSSLTITAVSTPAHGTAEIVSGKIRYTATAGYEGSDSFSYTVSDGTLTTTMTDNILVYLTAGTVTWNGCGTNNNWSTPTNWSGGTVPLTTDKIIFDSTSTKNCSIDTNISVSGITITSNYTGTITQNADKTITVGTGHWSQTNGNFVGGNSAMTVSGNFIVTGGSFVATTGNLTLAGGEITVTGAFTHNNGLITKSGGYATWNITQPIQNLVISTQGTFTTTHLHVLGNVTALGWNAHAGEMIVEGNFNTLFASQSTSTGKIIFKGSNNQVLSANGGIGCLSGVNINKSGGVFTIQDTLKLPLGLTWISGVVVATDATIIFTGGSQTIDAVGINFNHVEFNTAGNVTLSRPLKVDGNLTVTSINWLETERIEVKGNLTIADTFFWGNGVETHLVGGNDQIVNIAGTAGLRKSLIINKTGGIVSLGSNLNLSLAWQNINLVSGTFDLNGFNLNLGGTLKNSGLVKLVGSETVTLGDLDCSGQGTVTYYGTGTYPTLALGDSYHHLNLTGNFTQDYPLYALGDLNITGTLSSNGFDLFLGGNFINSGTYTSGTNSFYLIGKHQSISGSNSFHNLVKRNNTASSLTFPAGLTQTIAGNLDLVGTAGDLLVLKSSNVGSTWSINHTGATSRLGYLNIKDSISISELNAKGNSVDSGNNTNWIFTGTNALVWTGAVNNNFSNAGNWQGSVAPTANDVVEFLSGNSAVSIDIDANVAGVILGSGFSGSVTMATNKTFTIGFNGITIAGGTFTGNTKTIACSGDLVISNGVFDSVSSIVEILGGVQLSGGTLKSSTGLFEVGGDWLKSGGTFDAIGAITFNGFGGQTINAGGTDASSDFVNVNINFGTVTISNPLKINGNLIVNSGQLKNSSTISLSGNLDNNSGFINDQASALWVLNGAGSQNIKLQNHALKTVQVSNLIGNVTFTTDLIATELVGDAGTSILIEKGKLVQLNKLTLNGTASNLVKIKSNIAQQNAYFIVSGVQTLSYVEARGINAQFGPTLNGSNNCVDLGYNVNWLFPDNTGKPVITFTPTNDVFENNVAVTLASTGTAPVIHYTLDGSTPTTSSAIYSAPIEIVATTTIKAISVEEGNASIVFGKVYTAVQSAINDGLVYPVKSYGLNGIVYLGDSRRFEGQAWHVGVDGIMNTPDDYRVPEFDKYIVWSATQGTIERIEGTGGAVFTGNGSTNYYTITLTLGSKSFTGCNNSMPIGAIGAPNFGGQIPDNDLNPIYDPIENYENNCWPTKSVIPLPTRGHRVNLNIIRYAGFYNLSPFSFGRAARASGFHQIRVINGNRILMLIMDNEFGGWLPFDINANGKYYYDCGNRGYIEKIMSGSTIVGYKYVDRYGNTWLFQKTFNSGYFHITKVIDPFGNQIIYDYQSNSLLVITDASGNRYEVYADYLINGINQISRIVCIPFGSNLSRTWLYAYDTFGFISSVSYVDAFVTSGYWVYQLGADIHGNPIYCKDYAGCNIYREYDDVWRIIKYIAANGAISTFFYSGKSGSYYVNYINYLGFLTTYYRNQTPWGFFTTRIVPYGGLYTDYFYNARGFIYQVRKQLALNSTAYVITDYEYDSCYHMKRKIYDPLGQNLITNYNWDIYGNLLSVLNPYYGNAYYTYYNYNLLKTSSVFDMQGVQTYKRLVYNSYGQVAESYDLAGYRLYYNYDLFGNLIEESDCFGFVNYYAYNVWGGRIPYSNYVLDPSAYGLNNTKLTAWNVSPYIRNGYLNVSNIYGNPWGEYWFRFHVGSTAYATIDVRYFFGYYAHYLSSVYFDIILEDNVILSCNPSNYRQLVFNSKIIKLLQSGTYYIRIRGLYVTSYYSLCMFLNYQNNEPPVANNQDVALDEDTFKDITLSAEDPETSTYLTYNIQTQPLHGTLSGNGSVIKYTPFANYFGPDSFTFTASDGYHSSAPATVSITVFPINDAPVAVQDFIVTDGINVVNFDPKVNDTDIDNEANELQISTATNGTHGTVNIVNNMLVYTPNSANNENDLFTYTITDGQGGFSTATVIVNIGLNFSSVIVNRGGTVSYDLNLFRTHPNKTYTYQLEQPLPTIGNLFINGSTLTFTHTASNALPGSFNLTFIVDGKTATQQVNILVNDYLVVEEKNLLSELFWVEGETGKYELLLKDLDAVTGDGVLSVAISNNPIGLIVTTDQLTNRVTLVGTPPKGALGDFNLTLTITDKLGLTFNKTILNHVVAWDISSITTLDLIRLSSESIEVNWTVDPNAKGIANYLIEVATLDDKQLSYTVDKSLRTFVVSGLSPNIKTAVSIRTVSISDFQSPVKSKYTILGNLYVDGANGSDQNNGQAEAVRSGSGPVKTIAKAIGLSVSGQLIVVKSGIYRGEGNTNVRFNDKAIQLKSDEGAEKTVIDLHSQANTRGFIFDQNETRLTVLDGFTILNGNNPATLGSGIYINQSSPTIKNCVFKNLVGDKGGAIYLKNSAALVEGCLIDGNNASKGGAIYLDTNTQCQMNDLTIQNNSATLGGAVYSVSSSNSEINRCKIENNSSEKGAGVYVE